MNEFPPSRSRGFFALGILLIVFTAISAVGFLNIFAASVGPLFTVWIVMGVGGFIPLPFLAYRLYALARAGYAIGRDTLRLMWGLRVEDIPISDVEWVRPAHDLALPLRLPFPPLPGGILGTGRHPDLGPVEFMASDEKNMLLVATRRMVFVISPENPVQFVRAFQQAIEQGSLTPGQGRSQYPSFVVVQAWAHPLIRFFWVGGLLLNAALLLGVSAVIPTRQEIALGFSPTGQPLIADSPVQLILIPLVSSVLFVVGWLAGLFFYRRAERPLSYVLWGSGAVSALLFVVAVIILLGTPV